jgi:4-carboxymuconolactone decarboxylase
MFPGDESSLMTTDPEFVEYFGNFAFDEVVNQDDLRRPHSHDRHIRLSHRLPGIDEYTVDAGRGPYLGVTPVESKEIVYQALAYLGIGRVLHFFSPPMKS